MINEKASLVQIPSGYKSGTLYSVVPNTSAGDFTVTRGSTATRVNKDGLTESVAADVPRLNYDPSNPQDPHLLLEPTRTNECLYSKTLSSWTELNGGTLQTITDNDAIAPDGSLTASTITFTDTGTSLLRQFSNKAYTSNKHSSSFYAKKISGNGSVFFGITDTETEFTPTDEWVRYEVNNVTPTDFGTNLFLDLNFDCSAGDKIAVWGMQLEEGTYSTSIVKTSGNAVTRTADTCVDAGNNTIISSLDGSVFVDLTTTNDSSLKQINLFDGGNNRITIQVQFSTLSISIVSNVGGTIQTLYSWDVNINTNDRHKIAIRYEENNSKLYYNGLLQTPTTYTGSWFNDGVLDNFSFDKSGAFPFYGEIHQAIVFNKVLEQYELETITSYRSFNQMAKALLYTIE